MAMAAPAGSPHPVNIGSAVRRNSLVSDPQDMLLLREKLTRIAVGGERERAEADDESDERGGAGGEALRCAGRRRRRPPPFQVFGLPPGERPATPPSSPQPRDVLRRQLRARNQAASLAAAARRRCGSMSVAGSDEDEDAGVDADADAYVARRQALAGGSFVSVGAVEISRLEAVAGGGASAAASPTRARLSIPSHLRVSSSFSVLNKCPEGMRKRKSVHVEESTAEAAAPRNAMSRQGGGSLKKTSSQVNMLSHEKSTEAAGRLLKSLSSGALVGKGDDGDDQDMDDAWPDPEPPESPEGSSMGLPAK